ncbi:hypothetical protein D3C80_1234750 [compost metagenome]
MHRDGAFLETYLVSYIDAKQGTVPIAPLPEQVIEENTDPNTEEVLPETGSANTGNSSNIQTASNSTGAKSIADAGKGKKGKGQNKAAKESDKNNDE